MVRRFFNSLRNWLRGAPDAAGAAAEPAEDSAQAAPPSEPVPAVPASPILAVVEDAPPQAPSAEETAAAQSILDNESLTADLDDPAANALLEWGVANARQIARGFTTLFGEAADADMSERLRALRGMMRAVNQYVAGTEARDLVLEQIVEQARKVYGSSFRPPSAEARAAFIGSQATLLHNPEQIIRNLQRFIEEQRGGNNPQEHS